MEIITPPDFFLTLSDRYILLDTSFFIDSLLHPSQFVSFINQCKRDNITLLSLDTVKIEFLKGIPESKKYEERNTFFEKTVDSILPITPEIINNIYVLIRLYQEDGRVYHLLI
jgi:hypothetical protein